MTGGARAHARGGIWEWVHHALAAATLATALLIADAAHGLDWLDAVMLRIAAPAADRGTAAVAGDAPAKLLPAVVLIDEAGYARDFRLRSPLEREPLQRIISTIVETGPRLLLVDLQLEPVPGEGLQRPLDDLLIAAQGDGVQVVLPVPEPRTPDLDGVALQWMRRLCEKGVAFGSAQLRDHFGVVVRYDLDPRTLAAVAKAQPPTERDKRTEACLRNALALLEPRQRAVSARQAEPLSPVVLSRLGPNVVAADSRLGSQLRALSSDKVVVLGGSYDARDNFITIGGSQPGAVVHAAAFVGGVRDADHLHGWTVDVVLGTFLGWLFALAWGVHARLDQAMKRAHQSVPPRSRLHRAKAAYAWLAWGGLVWLLPVAIAVAVLLLVGRLMSHGWWLNPGPLIAGMFLHAMLLQHAPEHAHPADWRGFMKQHPACQWVQLPFIAVGLPLALWWMH